VVSALYFCRGLIVAALVLSPSLPRNRTPELLARFERETNPVNRAKLMPKLGSAEFREIETDVANREFESAAKLLHQYHAQVERCSKELDQANLNAVKKPAGFKQLQISVREALERLDRLISKMTIDEQARFRHDRDDLEELNSHLLQELFPGPRPRHGRYHIPIP
jgi:hypothetical protein